jgi:hypothetical protein
MPCGTRAGSHNADSRRSCRHRSCRSSSWPRQWPQHQRMCHLHLFRMRKQVIIDPAGEDRRCHGDHPGLGKGSDPGIQLAPGRTDPAFPVHTTSRVLHAIADRLLVNIQSDVIHIVSEEPPRLFSESACPLSSASCNTSCSSLTQHSNNTTAELERFVLPATTRYVCFARRRIVITPHTRASATVVSGLRSMGRCRTPPRNATYLTRSQ